MRYMKCGAQPASASTQTSFSFGCRSNTPPKMKGQTVSVGDVLGLKALKLMKERSFAVFIICSLLICIPLSFYYAFANVFLTELDAPFPTALQTVGQISEVVFMAAMPFFIMLVYDRVVPNNAQETLWVLAIGVAVVLAIVSLTLVFLNWSVRRASDETLFSNHIQRAMTAPPGG